MKEYIVIAKTEADIDSLDAELTRNTIHDATVNRHTVPGRTVQVANARLGNPRITHYFLSDQEAEKLCNDPRVETVHRVPNPDSKVKYVIQKPTAFNGTIGNFNRNSQVDPYNVNWGLRRTSLAGSETKIGNTYDYDVDGAGVDIVIMDDGVQADHPEFLDATGTSRVQQIDWYTATGIPGNMPARHYVYNGYGDAEHGTHVAATAAGKTFGYAKNSRIYVIRVFGTDDQVIPEADQFDLIRVWHTKKPIDPRTGVKRPTIVNMSWGYAWYYSDTPYYSTNNLRSIMYRNVIRNYPSGSVPRREFGMIPGGRHGLHIPSVDAEVQDAENAGIIFVHSAGNYSHKVDKVGGADYNNYYTVNGYWGGIIPPGQPVYYHRGGSPSSSNCITVSAARDTTTLYNKKVMEVVDSYSERGPGCDVIAPGSNITAATSKNSSFPLAEYVWGRNNVQDRGNKVTKISGTSMASPQVTGVLALYLSRNPRATPAQAKAWIAKKGVKGQVLTSAINNDWANPNALQGGPNNYLYNPYRNRYTD